MRRRVPLAASEPVAAWRGLAVAMAMLVLPLAALGFRSYDLAIHYLNPFIPCAALLTGSLIGVATLQRRRWLTAVASLVLALLVVTAALQTVLVVQALRFVATTDTTNGFGIPLANQLRARDAVMTLAAGQRPDLIATAAPADQARVIEALAWPAIEAHLTRSPETLVWRPGGSTISWVHPAARNAQAWLRSEAGSDGLVVPAPGGAELLVLRAIPQPGGRIGAPLARFANGVELLQTDPATLVDGRLTVPVRWRTTQAGAPHDTRWFVHLVDRDGQLLAQADGPGWLAAAWQPGDEMISWFSMPVEIIPPGVSVRAGMAVPGAGRVAIVNARGPVVDGNALALPLDLVR